MTPADRERQTRRLIQFVAWNLPFNLLMPPLLCIVAARWDRPIVYLIAAEIVVNAAILVWARAQAGKGNEEYAVVGISAGLLMITLTVAWVVPWQGPLGFGLIYLAVGVSLPFLSRGTMRVVMMLSTLVAALVAAFSLRPDPYDIFQTLPKWIIELALVGGSSLMMAITFMLIWQYNNRLNDTLAERETAMLALEKNERELEAKVVDRTRELAEKNEALLRFQRELAEARDLAVEATRAKSAFLATMSHEIRTPLNAVIGMTELLLTTTLDSRQREFAETVHTSGDALLAVINDILDFSKIEAGRMELEEAVFSLHAAVESAMDLVALRAQGKGLELVQFIDPNVPTHLTGDITRLRQVITNLLSNAVKFTAQGEIVLSVKRVDSAAAVTPTGHDDDGTISGEHALPLVELEFAVTDTGIGIAQDKMGKLFESFSQVDASTTKNYGGTGLGLAISRRLVELMGGTMSATSVEGKGSTFQFTVRLREAPATLVEPRPVEPQQTVMGRRALVIDDNETNRRLLGLHLTSWGMTCRASGSAEEALRWIERGDPFDVVICDMQMPGMDGLMLGRAIRAQRDIRMLPMVMLTSLGSEGAEARNAGFQATLAKPIKSSHLFNVLLQVLGGDAIAAAKPAAKPGQPNMGQTHPLRILVAEDNPINRKVVSSILESFGYRADLVEDGEQAVTAVVGGVYDVVLMDVQMPVMDGLEASRRICDALPRGKRPRIIALTANAMAGDREECQAAGMDDFVQKPLRADDLARALTAAPPLEATLANPAAADPDCVDDRALERLAETSDRAFVRELVEDFRAAAPRMLDELEAHLQKKDAASFTRCAHTLKSNSATLGAMALSRVCSEMEALGRVNTLSDAPALVAGARAEYARAERVLLEKTA